MSNITQPPDETTPTEPGGYLQGQGSGSPLSPWAQLVEAGGGTLNRAAALYLMYRHADRAWSYYDKDDWKPITGVLLVLVVVLTKATWPQFVRGLRQVVPWGKGSQSK